MRAAWYTEYGAARDVLRVGELADASPGPGEVLVRIFFSGVNPSDVNRRGGARGRENHPLIVPHNDGAGLIQAVGPGVDPKRVGERVWVYNGQRGGRAFGTCSELMAIDAAQAVRLPDNADLEAGACLGVPAMTAWYSLFADGDVKGQDVLVTGGAGAVGHYAIQLARLAGARTVITTISSAEKAAHAEKAGPTHIVNYRTEDVAKQVMQITEGRGVTRISEVDLGGNLAVTMQVAARKCVIGAYASRGGQNPALPFYDMLQKDMVVRCIFCSLMAAPLRAEGVRRLTQWMAEGRIIHSIGRVLPLEEIATAHELVERGEVIGKVLVRF
jgi:NADPH:quinone reductase